MFAFVQQPRNAEVQQLDLALPVHHHVAGLEVAVHHQLRMRGGHGLHHVHEQAQARFYIQLAFVTPAVDGLAAHQFQHQIGLAAITAAGDTGIEQARDVRVLQPRQDAALALEALAGLRAVQAAVHQLDGGLALVAAVAAPRQPDAGHAAFAQRGLDGPGAQVLPRRRVGRLGQRRTRQKLVAAGRFVPIKQPLQHASIFGRAGLQGSPPGRALGHRQVQRFVQQGAQAGPGGGVGGGVRERGWRG